MTACTEIRLGRQRFASRDLQLAVTVTAIAELSWQPAGSAVLGPCASAERVAQLVRAGRLWVSCGGSAFGLVVYPTLQRQDILLRGNSKSSGNSGNSGNSSPCAVAGWLAMAVLSWPAWDSLGLAVRLDGSDKDGASQSRWQSGDRRWDAGRLFFSVAHPSLPGGLCAPAGVPQAHFRRVVCRFNFALHPGGLEPGMASPARLGVEMKSTAKRANGHTKAKKKGKTTTQATAYQSGKQKATIARASKKRRGMARLSKEPASTVFSNGELQLKASTLIEASLYVLVGIKHRVLGVRPLEPIPVKPLPSLMGIAPAVWNYRHFQGVSARAVFVPSICKLLLDCCTNAQSPSLRRKAAAIFEDVESEHPKAGRLESKMHEIILKCVSTIPKRKRTSSRGGPEVISMGDHVQNHPDVPELDIHGVSTNQKVNSQRYGSENDFTAVVNEAAGNSYDEDGACWQEIADWPEEDGYWENDGSCASKYELADCEYQSEDMDWQEIEDWQLEDWEASEWHGFSGGRLRYSDEETESETEYMEIDANGVYMWQDGYGLIDEW